MMTKLLVVFTEWSIITVVLGLFVIVISPDLYHHPEGFSGGLQHPFSCVYISHWVLNVSSHTSRNDDKFLHVLICSVSL
jgi:hypothetical protein